jgi:hypothetical protein
VGTIKSNLTSGSFAASSWQTAQSGLTANKRVQMSSTGQYQLNVTSPTVYLSSDSGSTWTTLGTANGLPTGATWLSGSISATGQYIVLADNTGGFVWVSNDYGATFNNSTPQGVTPYAWYKFNDNVTDTQAASTITSTGTITYVTGVTPGQKAVRLYNTAGGTPTNYLRGTWSAPANFTVSFWFNPQTVNGTQQEIFSAVGSAIQVYITPSSNTIFYQFPSGGAGAVIGVQTTYAAMVHTWYYVTITFQTNGTCALYVNNNLAASDVNIGGLGTFTGSQFSLGTYDTALLNAYNGYIDDLKLIHSVSTYKPVATIPPAVWHKFENNVADSGSYHRPSLDTPAIYLPLDGSVTDSQGLSTVTATGSPTYVSSVPAGITSTQAIYFANTLGTVGNPFPDATQYVRGTWSGSSNWTVSFWFNIQSYSSTQGQSALFATANNNLIIMIYNSSIAIYSNGASRASSSSQPSLNTWHYVTYIHQDNGLCSLYLDNTLVGTYTNSGGIGTITQFALGTYDNSLTTPLNGYIDDVRIYNSAIAYTPLSIITSVGPITYTTGAVGSYALRLSNTVGSAPSQYVYGNWSGSSQFTISFWMNAQTLNGTQQNVTFVYGGACGIYLNGSNQIAYYLPSGGGLTAVTGVLTPYAIATNTWYHVYFTFQTNGACTLYVNGQLIGSYTNSGGVGSFTTSTYYIGTWTGLATPFNGFIDDYKIYNTVIPYNVLQSMNYSNCAVTGSGQSMYAASSMGYLLQSSDYGVTWSLPSSVQAPQESQTELSVSHTGQHALVTRKKRITPNLVGNTSSSWYQNGITWTATSSSNYGGFVPYTAFSEVTSNVWDSASNYAAPSGAYNNTYSTTVLGGVGTVYGEWLQLQSSIALTLAEYNYAVAGPTQLAKTYYIVGSMDGSNWYPLQYAVMTANPASTSYVRCNTMIQIHYTGTQSLRGDLTGSVTTTAYSFASNAYKYFRIIGTSTWGATEMGYTQFFPQFVVPTICPTLTNLASLVWAQQGVTWTASASSNAGAGFPASGAFNNLLSGSPYSWASAATYNITTGAYNTPGVTTVILGGIGTVSGEWLQIQSSVPLVLNNYSYGVAGVALSPKTYYIVGSTDGSSWYPVQYVAFGSTNPLTSGGTALKSTILVNYTGTQAVTGDTSQTLTTTAYSTTNVPYTYYRIIATTIWPNNTYGNFELCEFILNYTTPSFYTSTTGSTWTSTPLLNEPSTTLSGNGQVGLATSTHPIPFSHLTFDNGTADTYGQLTYSSTVLNGGSTMSFSTSIYKVGTASAYFNPTTPATTGGAYLLYNLPAALSAPSALTMACWVYQTVQVTNGTPMILNDGTNYGPEFYISGTGVVNVYYATSTSTGGTTLSSSNTAISANAWHHLAMTYGGGMMTLYVNGVVAAAGPVTGTLCSIGGGPLTRMMVGAAIPGYNAYKGYVDDIRLYLTTLSPQEVAWLYANPSIHPSLTVTSNSLASVTSPPLMTPLITSKITSSAVSFTGQVMVVTTVATTNNVYYSTNTGATWSSLTIPVSATDSLIGSSISADGSMIEVMTNTATYFINTNTAGNSIAIGAQAGQYNQAQNAIAIGSKAATRNQTANSIVLNASGQTLNASAAGLYVSPIQASTAAASSTVALLGHGDDSQIVRAGITVQPSTGYVGIGTTNPIFNLQVGNQATVSQSTIGLVGSIGASYIRLQDSWQHYNWYGYEIAGRDNGVSGHDLVFRGRWGPTTDFTEHMRIRNNGYVGIGKTNAAYLLDVNGSLNCTGLLVNGTAVATGTGSVWSVSGSNILYTSGYVGIGTTSPSAKLHIYGTSYDGGLVVRNAGAGDNYSLIALGNDAYPTAWYFWMNSSTRSADGGANTANIRNDVGDLRLMAQGGGDNVAIRLKASTGYVGIGNSTPSTLLAIGPAVYPSANSVGTTQLTVYGNANLYRNRLIFSDALTDFNHSIYNNMMNLDNEGGWDGMKMNVYNGLWVRTGNAAGVTPTTGLFVNSSGNVGIGTTSPLSIFNIHRSTGNNDPGLTISNNTTGVLTCGLAGGIGSYAGNAVGGDVVFRNDDSTKKVHLLAGSGNAVMTITNTSVGIGTTTPSYRLQVNTANNAGGISHTDGTISLVSWVGGSVSAGWWGTQSNHPLAFYTNNSGAQVLLTTSGNLGIGTTDVNSRLVTYEAGTTGWKGRGYFGNENRGFICGTYDNGVQIGGHNRAMNAWDNLKIGWDVQILGALSKASGSFDIVHPLHPATKQRLVHSFIEGPRCDLIYRGVARLQQGTYVVNLDRESTAKEECAMEAGTFEALCANPQFYLQNMDGFDRVRGTIVGATLTIHCENPQSTDRISWMVVAERKDPFIKQWDRTDADGYLVTQYTSTELPITRDSFPAPQ